MMSSAIPSDARADSRELLDPGYVRRLLCHNVPFNSAGAPMPCGVRVERVWPTGSDGYVFEWSFDLGAEPRYTVYGSMPGFAPPEHARGTPHLRMTKDGLRGVCVQAPPFDMTIHTPDFDPKMSHLAECLDGESMADRLLPILVRLDSRSAWSSRNARCALLAYRVGRRAAIRYRFRDLDPVTGTLVGKTYRDARGARLIKLHERINAELASYTGGAVRVPAALAYLSDVNLALFRWIPGRETSATLAELHRDATPVTDALVALHKVWVPDLPTFKLSDECDVLARWHGVLERLGGDLMRGAEPVLEGLLRLSDEVGEDTACTIHRDYYEKQILLTQRTTTILDLDTLASGSPCVDMGNLLAHLLLQTLRANGSPREFQTIETLLVARYEQRGRRLDRELLRFYFASALFRVGAVHARRTATGEYAEALWQRAGEVLSGGESGVRRAAV